MTTIDKRYDLFISYAHKDNPAPEYPITQLVALLKETYHSCYGEDISVFFDVDGLKPGELWENKLLESLRQSAVMIVVLSSDYYNSEYCYKEWRHFQDVEIHYSLPGTGIIANKYAEHAPAQETITPMVNVWIQDLSKRQHFDIVDWKTNRDTETFRQRLVTVCEQIREQKRKLEERKKIPTNVRPHNINFTGRALEIREVHAALVQSAVGVITAIKGIGGIGKSTIAYEYAHAYIDYYQGGTFNFNAEGQDDFRTALASIAAVVGIDFTDEEKKNPDLQCQRVWGIIKQGQPALLILDNVDNSEILKRITDYAPDRHKLHILVTSRQGFVASKSIKEFHIPPLEQSVSLGLLLKLFPAQNEDEWKAANAITLRLGGHPLSLTMVGAYLENRQDMSYATQLQWLEDEGIEALDNISAEISLEDYAHPVPTKIFEQMFSLLAPAELRVLEYAALLPPDSIPLPWLFELVKQEFPEIAPDPKKPYRNPWNDLTKKLERLQLLLLSVEEPQIGTMHRLIQDAIRQRHDRNQQYAETLIEYAYSIALFLDEIIDQGRIMPPEFLWIFKIQPLGEILEHVDCAQHASKIAFFETILGKMTMTVSLTDALKHCEESLEIIRQLLQNEPSNAIWLQDMSESLVRIGDVLKNYDLPAALKHYKESLEIRQKLVQKEPNNTEWQQYLSVSFNKVGDVLGNYGDLPAALKHYEQSLEIRRQLLQKDPCNTIWLRPMAASLQRVGNVLGDYGDLPAALKHYEESLEIIRQLVQKNPNNTERQRDLTVLLTKVGDVLQKNGDLPAALKHYEESLEIIQQLLQKDSNNTRWLRDMNEYLDKVGEVMQKKGDLLAALKHYEESLEIRRQLVQKDQNNTEWQWDLSISFINVGNVLINYGDLPAALKHYEESLEIRQQLLQKDSNNTQWQRDMAESFIKVGDVMVNYGDLPIALKHYEKSLEIRRQLVQKDPNNTLWKRDMTMSLVKVGSVLKNYGDLPAALKHFEESIEIRRQLLQKDLNNTEWQRDLTVSLYNAGVVLKNSGDLPGALKHFEESLEITRQLLQKDLNNTLWQRTLTVFLNNVGNVLKNQGDLHGALKHYEESLEVTRQLIRKDQNNTQWQRDLTVSLNNVGDVLKNFGDLPAALKHCEESLEIRRQLVQKDTKNIKWQQDLTVSLDNVGDVLKNTDDLPAALKHYEESLEIRRQLVQKDPNNAEWQRDLALTMNKVDDVLKNLQTTSYKDVTKK